MRFYDENILFPSACYNQMYKDIVPYTTSCYLEYKHIESITKVYIKLHYLTLKTEFSLSLMDYKNYFVFSVVQWNLKLSKGIPCKTTIYYKTFPSC